MFLDALGASLRGERVAWDMELTTENWVELFRLAQAHHVLPMIYEAVYGCPAARGADPRLMMAAKGQTLRSVMQQTMKTGEFLALMKHLQAQGLTPCVVKGLACRSLYPNPDHRMSGDEDVLIPPEQAERCHEAMLADLLSGGVYGDATMSRKHSSTMTLNAVSADRKGKKGRRSLLRTLFPRRSSLEHRYPYLKKYPFLLPAAWAGRMIGYARRQGKHNDNTAESLRIASERIELMRKYGIIR